MSQTLSEPRIVEFGPYRLIGLSYVGKNENAEIKGLWDGPASIFTRIGEIQSPPDGKFGDLDGHPMFGLCRCLPGATDGSFEYIAAAAAATDARLPDGLQEVAIPAGTYAAFEVPTLDDVMAAWEAIPAWQAAHPEWKGFCGPDGCDCENHPCFELYPPDFRQTGRIFVYVPVAPAT